MISRDLLALVENKDTPEICSAFSKAIKDKKLIYNEETIKNFLCQLMRVYKNEEDAFRIIKLCVNYINIQPIYSGSLSDSAIIGDGKVLKAAAEYQCHRNFIFLLKKYIHFITIPCVALDDYLVELANNTNHATQILDLLTIAIENNRSLFTRETIKKLFCTVMETHQNDLDFLKKAMASIKNYLYIEPYNSPNAVFKDGAVISKACALNLHRTILLLLKEYAYYIMPCSALDTYLLAIAKNEDNAEVICTLLPNANKSTFLFSPTILKDIMLSVLDWNDEVKQQKVLVEVRNYASKVNNFINSYALFEAFADNEVIKKACEKDSLAIIKCFIENYDHLLSENKPLSDYLLSKLTKEDYTCLMALLDEAILHGDLFHPKSLREVLNTAIEKNLTDLFSKTLAYLKEYYEVKKQNIVKNPNAINPLIKACQLQKWDFAQQLIEWIGDLREPHTALYRQFFRYENALKIAYQENRADIVKKLLDYGASLSEFSSEIKGEIEVSNPEIFSSIKNAYQVRKLFSLLRHSKTETSTDKHLQDMENVLASGISPDSMDGSKSNTPLVLASDLFTFRLTQNQIILFKQAVGLLVKYGANLSQLLAQHPDFPTRNYIDAALMRDHTTFIDALLAAIKDNKLDGRCIDDAIERSAFNPKKSTSFTQPENFIGSNNIAALKQTEPALPLPAPQLSLTLTDMIKRHFTDVNEYQFNWSLVEHVALKSVNPNETIAVGTKKMMFFNMPDQAGLCDVLIRCIKNDKDLPAPEQLKTLLAKGFKLLPAHSQSGLPFDALIKKLEIIDSSDSHYPTLIAYLHIFLELKLTCSENKKFINVITNWLLRDKTIVLSDNAIEYLKVFKMPVWEEIKTRINQGLISYDKLKIMNDELSSGGKSMTALRQVIWGGHPDPTKKRLGTILAELTDLVTQHETRSLKH